MWFRWAEQIYGELEKDGCFIGDRSSGKDYGYCVNDDELWFYYDSGEIVFFLSEDM